MLQFGIASISDEIADQTQDLADNTYSTGEISSPSGSSSLGASHESNESGNELPEIAESLDSTHAHAIDYDDDTYDDGNVNDDEIEREIHDNEDENGNNSSKWYLFYITW